MASSVSFHALPVILTLFCVSLSFKSNHSHTFSPYDPIAPQKKMTSASFNAPYGRVERRFAVFGKRKLPAWVIISDETDMDYGATAARAEHCSGPRSIFSNYV
jgi:hypothetical protein